MRPKYDNLLAYFSSKYYTQSFNKALPRPQISLEIGKKLCNEFHIDIHINDEDSVVYVFFIS